MNRLVRILGVTRLKRYVGLLLDFAVAGAAFVLAYLTVFDVARVRDYPGLQEKTLGFVLIFAFFHFVFSLHRGSWRYVSIPDLMRIIRAGAATMVVYTAFAFFITRGENVPRSVPIIAALYLVTGLAGSRLTYRLLLERTILRTSPERKARRAARNVLLYGMTDSAENFLRANSRDMKSDFNVVGIIDDNKMLKRRLMRDTRVLGTFDELDGIVRSLKATGTPVSEIIVTLIAPSRQLLGEIVEKAARLGLKASRIPEFNETAAITNNALVEPKQIELGDLLGRPEVVTDLELVATLIYGKVVLATGAGGSIGSELCRQIAQFEPKQLVISDSSEFALYLLDAELREKYPALAIATHIVDVRDTGRVQDIFAQFKPEVVFHAAALKHVPLVEADPLEGIKTNLFGTRNVADAALAHGAANFVMISTDKAVNPTNVMGATKRAAEAYCQALDVTSTTTRFKTVRFGNVLGSNGSVVPRFQKQINSGGPLTVTHPNIVRFFMTIPEAVRLVLNASSRALSNREERGKIMVLDMGKPVRIVDLAERMIQLAGYRPHVDIEIVYTGLRPGEKLYEELFDPSEVQNTETEGGYVVASPRITDKKFLLKSMTALQTALAGEDHKRALVLLTHIVPEYKKAPTQDIEGETVDDDVKVDSLSNYSPPAE